MKSGDPAPIDDLKLIIETKRHAPDRTLDVVCEEAQWMKAALKGAGVSFSYGSCDLADHYGYAAFTIIRQYRGEPVSLDLKIAEVREMPHFFAEVRSLGKYDGNLFPLYGELRSADNRDLLLHYIADFVVSTEP